MIDIREPVAAICELLGVEPTHVARLDVTPTALRAEVYLLDESGAKYIDLGTGKPAMVMREFEVVT